MSHYNIRTDDLKDSKNFTKAIVNNIVPQGGKPVEGTSLAERGYAGQSLTNVDIVSAASGNEIFGSSRYGNLYRLNIARENLNSLATTVMENQLPTVDDADPASLALRVMTRSGMGLEGSRGLVDEISAKLNAKYGTSEGSFNIDGLPHSFFEYGSSVVTVSSGARPVAFEKEMTDEEKKWRLERAQLLASKIKASDWEKSVLINGFPFDIRNNNLSARYDVSSIVPESKETYDTRVISRDIVTAPKQNAYMSASLVEFLIALVSEEFGPPLTINCQFGVHRQDGRADSRPNVSGGSAETITDHAFGRAVDIMSVYAQYDQVERKYTKNLSAITTKEGHLYQLDLILKKMNAMPQHLIPDYIAVGAKFVDEAYDTYSPKGGKLKTQYPNLKFLKLKRDESGAHNNHFHISFSPERGGRYVGTNGSVDNSIQRESNRTNAIIDKFDTVLIAVPNESGGITYKPAVVANQYDNAFGASFVNQGGITYRLLSPEEINQYDKAFGKPGGGTPVPGVMDTNWIRYINTPYGSSPVNTLAKSYVNNPQQIAPEEIFLALKTVGLFSDEVAAVFVALCNRESARRLYIVQPNVGALGLWQISTMPGPDGGLGEALLLHPEKIKTNYWKLALPDKTNLTSASAISAAIRERTNPNNPGNGIDKYDQRCWNLINQVALLRSKLGRANNLKQEISDMPIEPWGDTYLKYGFISSADNAPMRFQDAVNVYVRMANKSEGTLRGFIISKLLSKTNKGPAAVDGKSPTLQIDPENGKRVIENWFDGKNYPLIHV